jgi:PAS domain S-box-containing protein
MTVRIPDDVRPEVHRWLGDELFEHVPSNIVVVDRNYRVVLANRQFEEVFGKAVGRQCYEVYKRQDKVCDQCLAAQTFSDGKVHVNDEEGFDHRGKRAHYVVYTAPVRNEKGEITYVIEMSYDVTETKSLQRAYNILFDRAPCYIAVINRDLRIVRSNERLVKKFGDQVGEHCYKVYKNRTERCSDCPALKTFADGQCSHSEQVGQDKEGNPIHYIVSTAPLERSNTDCSYVIELSTDVTELHDLSDRLSHESSFRNIMIESTLDALVATDTSGKVKVFNRAAEKLFKISAGQVVGKMRGDRFLPDRFLRAVEAGEANLVLSEATVVDAEGERIPVRFSGSVLRNGDQVIGGSAFFQDLREFKELERRNLDNERLAAVGQTVAQLAHGIKNILNGLQGGMYIIRSGMRSGSQKRIDRGWDMLERNVERITVLVKGFLNFSKGYAPKATPTDPNALAKEVVELYRDAARKIGVELVWRPAQFVAPAMMDAEEIRSCLENLVSNAMDACKLSDNPKCSVTLAVEDHDGVLEFSVHDSGCGMDHEIKNKVFTTFFTTKGLGGTGLGLLITRKIVQQHGGSIAVDSTPGKGSTFHVRFPRNRLPCAESANILVEGNHQEENDDGGVGDGQS